ncbi:MAG: hypothetical protein U0Y10_00860 [Spirosomataceae bacterium]
MKRYTFLTISAVVGAFFAVYMLLAPNKMMESLGTSPSDSANVVLQATSVMLLSISAMTFLSRSDGGSLALRAILIGNIVMHVVALPIDWIAYEQGIFTQISGIIPGTVTHLVFAVGFVYFLAKLKKTNILISR